MNLIESLARYTGLSTHEVERLLALPATDMFEDPTYAGLLHGLALSRLEATHQAARSLLEVRIPPLSDQMQQEYALQRSTMSAFTLGHWSLGFLRNPGQVKILTSLHDALPAKMMRKYLPQIVGMLDDMGEGREDWQRLIALLGMLLVAADQG